MGTFILRAVYVSCNTEYFVVINSSLLVGLGIIL